MEKPVLHSSSVLRMIDATIMQKRRADSMSPCFTPLSMFTNLEIPMSVLIAAFESLYVLWSSLIYLLFMLVFSSNLHREGNLMLSNAFVKSIKTMYTGLLNSMDFSIICSSAIICSIVPLPGW